MKRDGKLKSIWQQTTVRSFNEMTGSSYDVAIVGGGITGVTCGYNLQRAGLKCIILEAVNLAFGTTGGTTAHLNTFFDAPYYEVQNDFGKENAKLLSEAGRDAIAFIKSAIEQHQIQCGFDDRNGFVFATDEKQVETLEKIVSSTKEVGLNMDYINDSPFAIPYLKIASIDGQAQFHPVEYIQGLANEFVKAGGVIAENCRVPDISKKDDELNIETSRGTISARHAVYATHIPPGVNILHFRCAPYRSYAIAVKLASGKYPEALGYDLEEPYHYYRTQVINGSEYLIAGGEDHKTGHEENTDQCFRKLESYVRRYYDVASVDFKWSSQYYVPVDGLPYIGHLPGNPSNVYCATGFNGNGMIFGTLSGMILKDLILSGENKYKDLFRPSRIKPAAGFENFVKEAADVVFDFIADKLFVKKLEGFNEMAPGEAKIVKYEGQTVAAFKDEDHKLHMVNAACTHIKCNVGWNSAEQTWDCPCHGSRFSCDGKVLTAPARKDLERIDPDING